MPWFGNLRRVLRHGQRRPAGHLRLRRRVHGHTRQLQGQLLVRGTGGDHADLGAAYTLWLVKRVIFGEVGNEKVQALQDLDGREFALLSVLAVTVLALGVWPDPLVDVMHVTVSQLLEQATMSKLPTLEAAL
jgi:hypothetical protein